MADLLEAEAARLRTEDAAGAPPLEDALDPVPFEEDPSFESALALAERGP